MTATATSAASMRYCGGRGGSTSRLFEQWRPQPRAFWLSFACFVRSMTKARTEWADAIECWLVLPCIGWAGLLPTVLPTRVRSTLKAAVGIEFLGCPDRSPSWLLDLMEWSSYRSIQPEPSSPIVHIGDQLPKIL